MSIDDDGVHLPRRKRAPETPAVARGHKLLAGHYGTPQLSDVLIEVDNEARFSWALLGRPAYSAAELITLYVALLALGSDLTVAALDRMVAGVEPDTLAAMMQRLGGGARFRVANDAVVGFMRRHAVARLWGGGLSASADMMSLDATRYLWNARLDPRRKGPAIGTYPHVLDQWSIFYDQPIVLGKRQAGAAIEGTLRQTAVEKLERVAVDTRLYAFCPGGRQILRLRSLSPTCRHPKPQTLSSARISRHGSGCSETDRLSGNDFPKGDRPWLGRLRAAQRFDQGWLVSGSRTPFVSINR